MAYHEERTPGLFRLEGWTFPILGVLTIALALFAIAATRAEATNGEEGATCGDGACISEADSHRGFGHHRRGRGWFGRDRHDPEDAKEHLQFAAGWMMRKLDVEEPAREQIRARLDAAFDELHPLVLKHRESKGAWVEAVLGEQVDREALARQREETIDAAEDAIEIMSDAMADISELLTPEQRAQIAERIRRHHR